MMPILASTLLMEMAPLVGFSELVAEEEEEVPVEVPLPVVLPPVEEILSVELYHRTNTLANATPK